MIVGVARSQLLGEHESVRRALVEILIPRMSQSELSKIITDNLLTIDMTIEPDALGGIVRLAEGLPMYAHLLGQRAALQAVQEDRLDVTISDVEAAIQRSIKSHMLRSDYLTATQSSRPGNLYSRVLVACAMADKNALGQFRAGAVRAPMSQIMGSTYNIPAFARHLTEFTEPSRGSVLIREIGSADIHIDSGIRCFSLMR